MNSQRFLLINATICIYIPIYTCFVLKIGNYIKCEIIALYHSPINNFNDFITYLF